jgi:hypothetical protein
MAGGEDEQREGEGDEEGIARSHRESPLSEVRASSMERLDRDVNILYLAVF